MADLTQTATSVVTSGNSSVRTSEGIAGATITAGMPVYLDSTDGNSVKPADASTLVTAAVAGIALNGGADGQPIEYVTRDSALNVGATLAVGQTYVASATAGAIALESDILSTEFVTILGIANTTSAMNFSTGENMRASIAHA